jgi:cytochrome c-type biogenesis protein CcmE
MKKLQIISLIVIAAAIGAIMVFSQDYTTYASFYTAKLNEGKDFHVVGELVKEKPQEYNPHKDANLFSFYMRDQEGNVQQVIYRGTKPDGFDRTEKIVVSGEMNGALFEANKILMKCPSKYVNEQAEIKEN